MDQCREEEEMQ